jgi:predicted DNA-binding protein with PD1-like motif
MIKMQSKEKNNIIFLRLFPDECVNEQLQIVCMKHKIKTAVVISGIGQLLQAKIGYFKEKEPVISSKILMIITLIYILFLGMKKKMLLAGIL